MTCHSAFSKTEKRFFIAVACFVLLLLGAIGWLYYRDLDPHVTLPTVTLPNPNAHDYFAKASDIAQQSMNNTMKKPSFNMLFKCTRPTLRHGMPTFSTPLNPQHPEVTWETVNALTAQMVPATAQLHQGFAMAYQVPPQPSMYQDFISYLSLAMLLSVNGNARAHAGDWGGATDYYLDAVQFGAKVEGHNSMMVAKNVQDDGRMNAMLISRQLSAAQARTATRRMEAIIAQIPSEREVLLAEKDQRLRCLLDMLHKPGWRKGIFPSHGGLFSPQMQVSFYTKRDIVNHLVRFMDAQIASTQQPYTTRKAEVLTNPHDLQIRDEMDTSLGYTPFMYHCNATFNALLLASYALQAYHQEKRTYPASLAELVPGYLHAIPNDPFAANKPLCYKRTGADFLLYSIGPDGKDDGGVTSNSGAAGAKPGDFERMLSNASRGDIVAGVDLR